MRAVMMMQEERERHVCVSRGSHVSGTRCTKSLTSVTSFHPPLSCLLSLPLIYGSSWGSHVCPRGQEASRRPPLRPKRTAELHRSLMRHPGSYSRSHSHTLASFPPFICASMHTHTHPESPRMMTLRRTFLRADMATWSEDQRLGERGRRTGWHTWAEREVSR